MKLPKLDYRTLRWPLGVVAIAVLAWVVARQWDGVAAAIGNARAGRLWALLPVATVLTVLAPTGWHLLIRRLGAQIRWSRSIEIWLVAATARFIPGGIWTFAGRYALTRRDSIPGPLVAVSLYLETILIATSSLAIGLPALLLKGTEWPAAGLALAVIAGLALLLRPATVSFLVRRFSREPSAAGLDSPGLGTLVPFYGVYWCLWGAWFSLFASCFHDFPPGEMIYLACTFALAYWAGFVTLVFPGGVGVREGVLLTLLLPVFPGDVALAISVSSRLWMICAELPALLLAVAWARVSRPAISGARLPEQENVGR